MFKGDRNMMSKYMFGIVMVAALVGCGRGPVGATGPSGSNGTNGQQGNTGAAGPQGAQGSPGIDGTSVTVVKFCPGVTTYPSTFVEVGFCIGGKLYGTYSANDGFSSELPPGSYGSKGINASCNFVIAANCVINN
jgi:hypothetical protein